jgi:hypothetical protein
LDYPVRPRRFWYRYLDIVVIDQAGIPHSINAEVIERALAEL